MWAIPAGGDAVELLTANPETALPRPFQRPPGGEEPAPRCGNLLYQFKTFHLICKTYGRGLPTP
jgi:hypothetical protein